MLMFVAPFGIVGLFKRIARLVVVIEPRMAGHPLVELPVLSTTEAGAEQGSSGPAVILP
ncbi:MAG TPA: hypothetical protein VMM60_18710 [Ilumatobacter sp.]|nr:hypothetical protein [Ilumatobacter sp.]